MPDSLAELRVELARANRILANEGIIDAFGHISARHPGNPNRYFISRHRASELVEPADVLEMTLDSEPVDADQRAALQRDGDPRRDLQSAAGRELGVPPSRHGGAAVLRHRRGAGSAVPSRRHARRQGAVLGQPRRVRRYQSAGAHARGRRLAGARARPAFHGAAAPPRRDAASARACANACSARSTPPTMPNCSCAPWRSERRGRSRPARPRRPAATTWARAASSAPGNIGACACRRPRRRGRRAACRWSPAELRGRAAARGRRQAREAARRATRAKAKAGRRRS